MLHNAATHAKLYIADPKLAPQMYADRNSDFTVVVHHADGATHLEAMRLEAAFLADPTWRTARDFLWAALDDLEPYQPENPVGSTQPSSGFLPSGRILVTQGRALPEFNEMWTSAGYSAFCLANPDGGWDCNEFTGDVLRSAGLNGMGFPVSSFGGPVDDILDDDVYGWDETIETITLSIQCTTCNRMVAVEDCVEVTAGDLKHTGDDGNIHSI